MCLTVYCKLYLTIDPVGWFSVINSQTVSDTNGTHNRFIYKEQFTEAVYQAYQGSDRDEVVASAPNQSKVKHVARWVQQKAKAQGYIVRGQERGQWVVN